MNLHDFDLNRPQINLNSGEIEGVACEGSCVQALDAPQGSSYDDGSDITLLNFDYMPCGSVVVLLADLRRYDGRIRSEILAVEPLRAALAKLDLHNFNYLMWSCENEERDRSKGVRGVYQFPEATPVVYSGFAGVIQMISEVHRSLKPEDHPFCRNIGAGDWLLDYHNSRIREMSDTIDTTDASDFVRIFSEAIDLIKLSPHRNLRVQIVDHLFSTVYDECVREILRRMPKCTELIDPFVQELAVATTHFMGIVNSASLHESLRTPTMSAGLPHFSTEYVREWGRDTFIALPGCLIATGRFEDAEREILGYGRVLRHGLIPNLLDRSSNPRFNARDAVWFWLNAIRIYNRHAPEAGILKKEIDFKFPISLDYSVDQTDRTVGHTIHLILSCHHRGISYREWNAGHKIDDQMKDGGFNVVIRCDKDSGLCLGGNRWNCGTWMDKMGSSEKVGLKIEMISASG